MPGKTTEVFAAHLAGMSRKLRKTVQLHHRLIWAFNLNIPLLIFFCVMSVIRIEFPCESTSREGTNQPKVTQHFLSRE